MEIRGITSDEAVEHLKMIQYAFGRYTSEEPKQDEIDTDPTDSVLAAFDGKTMASCLTLHSFRQSVRGSVRAMGGLGGVATRPEYRGCGLVRTLLDKTFRTMRTNGQSVSMLRPFKEAFYRGFGYAATNGQIDYSVDCRNFQQFVGADKSFEAQVIPAAKAKGLYFSALDEQFSSTHGRILDHQLNDSQWARRMKDRLLLIIRSKSDPVAMATYQKDGFLEAGTMKMQDCFWKDPQSRQALFAYIARHQDQISRVSMTVPYDTNIHELIPALEGRVDSTYHSAPWMVRVVDVIPALEGLPAAGEVSTTLKIRDSDCSWNNLTVAVKAENGVFRARPVDQPADLVMSISGLSALVFGARNRDALMQEHEIEVLNLQAWQALCRALPQRTLFNDYWF